MKKVLILAAHADDDILGCGGTMAKHSDQGDEVSVLFLTNGVGARGKGDSISQNIDFRDQAAEKALELSVPSCLIVLIFQIMPLIACHVSK